MIHKFCVAHLRLPDFLIACQKFVELQPKNRVWRGYYLAYVGPPKSFSLLLDNCYGDGNWNFLLVKNQDVGVSSALFRCFARQQG